MESTISTHDAVKNDFYPYVIKWGRITNLSGIILTFIPCIVLMILGAQPSWSAVLAAVIMRVSLSGAYYIVEPVSYFTILGIPGTYMSFLSGNISNMRVPAAIVAQEAAGVQPGSDKGSIISTIGVATSTGVNVVILTITVIGGSALISILPDTIVGMFDYILPALFAALMATAVASNRKIACIGVPLGALMTIGYKLGMLNFLPSAIRVAVVLIVSVFGTIGLGLLMDKKKEEVK